MQPLFRINLSSPLKKTSEYLDILRKVDYPRLFLQFDHYKEMLSPENPKPLEGRIRRILRLHNKELRTLHYCSYLHPREYSQSENSAQNWYDIEDHRRRFWTGLPLYQDHTGHLKTHVLQQHSFVRKIKRADPSFKIGEESIVRYEQFMTLIKKHGHETKLSPPLDVDIIWHAHMLNHTSYVEATKEYFGTILDHDDSEKPEKQLQLQKNETSKLWEKHYGKGDTYSPSSCSSGLSTFFIVDNLLHHSAPSSHSSGSFDTDSDCDSGCSGCGD